MADSNNSQEPLVRIRGLRFYRSERAIFDGVDIDIPRGKITAIMGPSGTGKTTLLKLIGGQLRPQAGSIHVDGEDIHTLGTRISTVCECVWVCSSRVEPCLPISLFSTM